MKKIIILISINVFLVIGFCVCLIVANSIISSLRSQQAAQAWAGQSDERFAQVSAFFPQSRQFEQQDIFAIRNAVDTALLAVSIEAQGRRVFYSDAWTSEGSVNILSERSSSSASAIGVGGNFFMFHPLRLRDGSYISPDDFARNRVVLDEELAWRLFGSAELAGLEVFINNQPFTISGVVARENDFATRRAYDRGAGLFMSHEALSMLTDGEARIKSYKIVMPDPITGFALNTITDFFEEADVHMVENSARFSLSRAFSRIASFGERSMLTEAIELPYWENAARFAEDVQALLLAISIVLIITPIVFLIILIVKLIRYLIRRSKRTIIRAIEERDRRAYEKYVAEHYTDAGQNNYSVDEIIREVKEDGFV